MSALVDRFFTLTSLAPGDGPDRSTPTPVPPVATSLSVETLVFEDDITLTWDVYVKEDRPAREVDDSGRLRAEITPGFISRIAERMVLGPMP